MLSLLLTIKTYWRLLSELALMITIAILLYMHQSDLTKIANQKADITIQNTAIAQWQAQGAELTKKLAEVQHQSAKRYKESHKRIKNIQGLKLSEDCNQAIQQGIEYLYHPVQ